MEPEVRIEKRVAAVFYMRNIAEMSRRTGYPQSTLRNWKKDPSKIRAVDLEILEERIQKGPARRERQ